MEVEKKIEEKAQKYRQQYGSRVGVLALTQTTLRRSAGSAKTTERKNADIKVGVMVASWTYTGGRQFTNGQR
ncbi:hypothetical protein Sjap_022184 [Stephania japonica]|uniref:Uncharacterized protein n=1 Tax=Stephania japonica TaxID=461633 RepID=A0AAP0HTH0_9MAGN